MTDIKPIQTDTNYPALLRDHEEVEKQYVEYATRLPCPHTGLSAFPLQPETTAPSVVNVPKTATIDRKHFYECMQYPQGPHGMTGPTTVYFELDPRCPRAAQHQAVKLQPLIS
jgi:hypothetical protein